MKIYFTGSKPDSYYYSYSVIGNENVDRLEFILNSNHDGYNLTELTPQVRVKSTDGTYRDVFTSLDNTVSSDGTITIYLTLRSPMTSYEELELQLVFTGATDTWQSEKFNLYLKETMLMDDDSTPTFTEAMKSKAEVIIKNTKEDFPDIGSPKNLYICDSGIYTYDKEIGYILQATNCENITEIKVKRGAA